jgi:hypothetical protein
MRYTMIGNNASVFVTNIRPFQTPVYALVVSTFPHYRQSSSLILILILDIIIT